LKEAVTSTPPGAHIYWGKAEASLERSEHVTPHSRSIRSIRSSFGSGWESWCFQVRKEGYHDSEVICRPEEDDYRHVDFYLEPIKTIISSEPPGADIYWGSSKDKLEETIHKTPRIEKGVRLGASWKAWYFKVKKEGYYDSEIVFKPRSSSDRHVHFELRPLD
jgi:hypothetical protein